MGRGFNPGSSQKLLELMVKARDRQVCYTSVSKYKEMIMALGRVTEYEIEEVALRHGFNRQWLQAPSKQGGSERSQPEVGDLAVSRQMQ